MPRPPVPVGEASPFTYASRPTPYAPWTAWDLAAARAANITRTAAGRAWRARTKVRIDADTTRVLTRIGPTPPEAAATLQAAVDEALADARAARDADGPTLRTYLQWVQARIADRLDPDVTSEASRTRYLSVLSTWGGLPPHDGGKRSHRYQSGVLDVPLVALTPAMLDDEITAVRAGGGGAALGQLRALWRKALARAVREGVITQSPASDLRITGARSSRGTRVYANGHVRRRDDAFTDAQVTAILEYASADARAVKQGTWTLLEVAAATGLRISEAVSLRWSDVDLDGVPPMLSVRGQLTRRPGHGLVFDERLKSALSRRDVPMTARLAAHLRDRHESREGSERRLASPYVLATERAPIPDPDNARARVRVVLDAAGFPWATLHTFRRTVENRLVAGRVPPQVVERLMGHTSAVGHGAYWDRDPDVRAAVSVLE